MQEIHSPKPEIFGKGYGQHILHNYRLMKQFFWLGWKMLVHMFIPGVFYERAHWEVIDLYHKMRGLRHGTVSDHRCPECGHDLPSADEMYQERNELKQLEIQLELIGGFDKKMDEYHAEEDDRDTRIGLRGLDYAADADRAEKEPKE